MNMIALRKAEASDLSFLMNLRRETMRAVVENHYPWNEDHQEDRVLVDFEHAKIILWNEVSIGLWKTVRRRDHIELVQIQVLPSYQRKGIGRALISGLQEEAQHEGSMITLHVFRSNPAINLYSRLGFQVAQVDDHSFMMQWKPVHGTNPESDAAYIGGKLPPFSMSIDARR